MSPPTGRRPRADAQRNRSRLIAAARAVVDEDGGLGSLDRVAQEAGVSIATLYRHFPQRDALIEAIYTEEVDALVTAARELGAERDPIEALREWLLLFVEFLDTKRGMSEVLGTLLRGPDALFRDSTERLSSSVAELVLQAQSSGQLSAGIDPVDLLRALGGVASVNPSEAWRASAVGLVDVLLRGLQHRDDAGNETRP
ncbi:TetR/AcrR family transcriptional regulator [Spiractinospora alimapuensis]|uniref:TetR family transcriptional regulator n=1 Tax=Ornithinicoccus hortensis TaxID=82346 RepID=A0A542YPX7_9MICO|nr:MULTISPECIES: TetR/AcrR family transcriptional regulator [Actinomycetes]QVQ51484.1 TetR/AcrR family transcriptional regulator [Spiractinospora alimapuensis]TQL50107.1 TetR family transcriptional regulator [Ornithinicoccus hortensis]